MVKVYYYRCVCGHAGADRIEGEPPFPAWNKLCSACGEKQFFYKMAINPKESYTKEFCNITGMIDEHPRYSVSLGVLDEQLSEARRLHPKTEWKKFGNSWRPLIRNRADKLRTMREAKMEEY